MTSCDIENIKVDKLAPCNTLHAARNRYPKLFDISGVGKVCQFLYMYVCMYCMYGLESFLKLVKSTLSFLGDISQVQTRPLKTVADFL